MEATTFLFQETWQLNETHGWLAYNPISKICFLTDCYDPPYDNYLVALNYGILS